MKRFSFRMQKVLEYRRMVEDWAKTAYTESQARLLSGQSDLAAMKSKREQVLRSPWEPTIEARQNLDAYLERLEDEARAQLAVIGVLENEVDEARAEWLLARQEAEAMQKLRDKALEEWQLEVNRAEQREMDEFANNRREAA